jgi:hypothetical protein
MSDDETITPDETPAATTRVQCEPAGTVYCDDYEAIVGPKPATDALATVVATKVVTPESA